MRLMTPATMPAALSIVVRAPIGAESDLEPHLDHFLSPRVIGGRPQ